MNSLYDTLDWAFLFFALAGTALLLRSLSRRLGEALHTKKYYLLYDVSILASAISLAVLFFSNGEGVPADAARLFFLSGALLAVLVTVRYWGWIIPEIIKPGK